MNWRGRLYPGDTVRLKPVEGEPVRYVITYSDGGRVELVTDQLVVVTVGATPFDLSVGGTTLDTGFDGAHTRPQLRVIDGGKTD